MTDVMQRAIRHVVRDAANVFELKDDQLVPKAWRHGSRRSLDAALAVAVVAAAENEGAVLVCSASADALAFSERWGVCRLVG